MTLARASILVFVVVTLLTTLFMIRLSQGQAAPTTPTDATKVPHYFGPWSNWALSPLTTGDATVTIGGDGTGAKAVATVGGNGAITGITVTDPGSGYTGAPVTITGAGTGALATATITNSGAVVAINVTANGGAYTKPVVTIAGGGATTDATATAYGLVDAITLTAGGTGYKFPTVDFDMPDDPNGVQAQAHATIDANGVVTAITLDNPGSGYASAPNMVIRDGTLFDPIANGGTGATATATIDVQAVVPDTFGAGYTGTPTVTITDSAGVGTGAAATAQVDNGLISAIAVTAPGSGYVTPGGIKKFQDQLPMLCNPAVPGSCSTAAGAKFLPLAVPEEKTYNDPTNKPIKSDEYEIGLIQYRTKFNTDLPPTLVRGYVQLESPSWLTAHPGVSQHFLLENELLDGTKVPVMVDGKQAYGVTAPQWLGPIIGATKDKPVRIVFRNLLPTGSDGDLFLPTDSTLMGSGMGPMGLPDPTDEGTVLDKVRNPVCGEAPKSKDCFKDNRATLHLHGGVSPWISDGTPHQWITPANEDTPWPEGVDVRYVPDMPVGNDPKDGVMTFYYTNQQSARLMFYHDHAWGITRLNVYAGEAAGYLISDDTEKALLASGTIPADQIPLVVQDRTFVPQDSQLYDTRDAQGKVLTYGQDPTWDRTRWGGYGDFWYHHVYMPAQNPGDPGGMSAYGRWMYGPWFWPPAAATQYGPIDNPYYTAACDLNDPATWTYQTDPFCEPAKIPGTPNISAGMEQFNDTPVVNGIAYPEVTLQPQSYRFRMLNAANDRFFNFQWYVADPSTGTDSEVALDPLLLAQAQTDPVVFPTPVHNATTAGPDWIQIGTEGGFLPAPVVVDGQQEMTWITDPTRFDFGNGDKHSLLLAPAERADVIVDFSQFAGKTLILYNDAPAAFPARIPSYDYYTGQPDLSPNGPSMVLPGYGPNTRTIMRVKIAAATPAAAFNLAKLRSAFSHKANGTGVFESGQHPIIVGQAAYNSAYGTGFSTGSDCNAAGSTLSICDGFVRVNDTAQFGFNTLAKPTTKTVMPLQPKAIHDEMNATTFDEYGRMQANLGVEAQPPQPGLQNVTLYPYVNPITEIIDGTNLPKSQVVYDANGAVVSDVKITPMSDAKDGTQIWRVTHNGVDTHPIHFHLYDVQILNRVTWDNIIIAPDKEELGWKDTVRMAPLEDTIVALRPIVPDVPWEVPNQIRNLNPMEQTGSQKLFNNIDPQGNPTAAITNQLVNYGWGYVWHCHILSHEEMDMMRPQTLLLPPLKADGLTFSYANGTAELTFNDNSITETSFDIQRDDGTGMKTVGTIDSPLAADNIHQSRTFVDASYDPSVTYSYQVVANNKVGYGAEFPTMTASSTSAIVTSGPGPAAPTNLQWAFGSVDLTWTDNASDETGFTVQRADNGGAFATVATLPANTVADPTITGPVSYSDKTVKPGDSYIYRVRTDKGAASSAWLTTGTIAYPAVPAAPTGLTVTLQAGPQGKLDWTDNATNEDAYVVERSPHGANTWTTLTGTLPANTVTYTDGPLAAGDDWDYRVAAKQNIVGLSPYSNVVRLQVPAMPAAPTGVAAAVAAGPQVNVTWTDNATNETAYMVQRSVNGGAFADLAALPANSASYADAAVTPGTSYQYQVRAVNLAGASNWAQSNTVLVPAIPADPTNLAGVVKAGPSITLTWTDNATTEAGYTLQRSSDNGATWTPVANALPANTTGYVDTPVTMGATYLYQVRAYNVSGVSNWAVSAAIAVPTPPAAPTNLTRTVTRTAAGPDTVTLRWADNANNETGFVIQRATNSGFTANLTTLTAAANATSYADRVAHGFTYYYRVQAVNVVAASAWSNTVNATTVPATPTGLRATNIGRTALTLNWSDVSANETGYQVQRKRANSNNWTNVTTTAANATSFRVTGLNRNTAYDFRVRGRNGVGDSPWTANLRVRTLP
jgi:FtsP/CotA-like multicopper oxidase with cupredoxin domain